MLMFAQEMTCSADVMLALQTRSEWPAAELSASLQISITLLRRKMIFWVNQGAVVEEDRQTGISKYGHESRERHETAAAIYYVLILKTNCNPSY